MERPTDLHTHLARRVLAHIRALQLPPGHHLTEQSLQKLLGVSRGPIRAALNYLAEHGVLERRANRGFAVGAAGAIEPLPENAEDAAYRAIAADRISGSLPGVVSETELARRYDLPRHRLARILDRISAEGWIEKRRGHGWAFLALINSPEAYRECYELRLLLEPAALRLPTFRLEPRGLDDLEREQMHVLDGAHRTLSQIELFETNSRFHEGLAAMSGNRFVLQTIVRQNQLRRLVEYRRPHDTDRVRRVCEEHLGIIALVRTGSIEAAAEALGTHLRSAADEKTQARDFVALTEG